MEQIFLVLNGQQAGPFPVEQVRQGAARGEYPAETLAWHDGLPEWRPLASVLGSAPADVLPPVPASAVPTVAASGQVVTIYEASFTRDELRRVALFQNLLMWSLLAGIVATIIVRVIPVAGVFLYIPAVVFEIYSLYSLNRSLRVRAPWVYCILLFVPLISLITLYVFSNRATKVLKANGIPVGFMGAKPGDVR